MKAKKAWNKNINDKRFSTANQKNLMKNNEWVNKDSGNINQNLIHFHTPQYLCSF